MKEKFIKSTIILIIGGGITKLLGMFIRIVMTRIVGDEGIGLYMLIFPTFSLFMTISQLGFPTAISKLVAEDKYNNKNIVFSIIPVSLVLNIILMGIVFILAPIISNNLLNDQRCYYPILAIALVLPFDSLSSILRGYFFGKEKMIPHIISNVFEQIVRLLLIILLIPNLLDKSLIIAVSGLILVNVISELSSILILFVFLPKNFKISKNDLLPNKNNIKEVLSIAIPTTGGRLIGSISYFLEPIILTFALLKSGYSSNYIINEYGVIEGYVIPLLMLPSFFTTAISNALLPSIAKNYSDNNINYVSNKLKQSIIISLLIGIPTVLILLLFPNIFLKLIYNTTHGSKYIRFIAPLFIIYYLQAPFSSLLQSINKSTNMMINFFIGIIFKLSIIFITSFFNIGLYSLLLGIMANISIVTYLHYRTIKKTLYQ